MIILSKKRIHKWKFWKKKGKFLFCIFSGGLYAIVFFVGAYSSKWIFGNGMTDHLQHSIEIAGAGFVAASFLSIAHWHENERRYKKWKQE
jgi:hypothetical protein